jgi:UrcA family protein
MNKTMTTAARAITICLAVTLGYATEASAGGIQNEQSVAGAPLEYVVHFQDLDLSQINGAAALYARLLHAANVVCAPLESRDLALAETHRACVDSAITGAVASVNRPLLSRYHELRTKGDNAGLVRLAKAN